MGGEALYHIYNASRATSAQHNISALVRHANSDAQILKAFPEVRIVRGDLDAVDLIEQEAKNADAVFRKCSSHSACRTPRRMLQLISARPCEHQASAQQ